MNGTIKGVVKKFEKVAEYDPTGTVFKGVKTVIELYENGDHGRKVMVTFGEESVDKSACSMVVCSCGGEDVVREATRELTAWLTKYADKVDVSLMSKGQTVSYNVGLRG